MRKWILITATVLVLLCFYMATTATSLCLATGNIKVKYIGGDIYPTQPDSFLDSHASDLASSNLNFYVNSLLIPKTLTDSGTALLLSLPTGSTYTLTSEFIDYPYWIYTFNLTYTCSFNVDSTGKLNSITYAYGSDKIRYNPVTDTLYIGTPLLETPQYEIASDRLTILAIIGICVGAILIWKVRKH